MEKLFIMGIVCVCLNDGHSFNLDDGLIVGNVCLFQLDIHSKISISQHV